MYDHIQRWSLIRREGSPFFQVRVHFTDGQVKEKSTKKRNRREAEAASHVILSQMSDIACYEKHGWVQFCLRYEREHLGNRPAKTIENFRSAVARFDSLVQVEFVSDITSKKLVEFAVRLRAEGKSEATIQAYRDHLMSSLTWAEQMGYIKERPKPPRLSRVPSGTRGRALSEEEFERMVSVLPQVVGEKYSPRWEWNLRAMWLSGLRLGETFHVYWNQTTDGHYIFDLDTPRPKLSISAFHEKAFMDRVIPITPDFAEFLREVPLDNRSGRLFLWPLSRGLSESIKTVGKRISETGRLANVVTSRNKYASSHDLRRSFGTRWSFRVQPFVLRTLMRHSSITTTEKYYVSQNSDRVGDALYSAS